MREKRCGVHARADVVEGVRICERGERIAQRLWLGEKIGQIGATNSIEIDSHAISLPITR